MTDNTAPNDTETSEGTLHVQIILDRSGSMAPIAAATIDGINGFLAKQRKHPAPLRLSLADFDSQEPFRVVADAIPIAEVLDLTAHDYEPRGGTPLFDAIGTAIERCDARAADYPDEEPLLVIVTDGEENASTEYNGAQIAELLDQRQAAGWTVLFLGANQDSFATGTALNMTTGNIRNFDATHGGITAALGLASNSIIEHRTRTRAERRTRRTELFDQVEPPTEQ